MKMIRGRWYPKPGSRYPVRLCLCKGKFKSGVKYTRHAKPSPDSAEKGDCSGFHLPEWSKYELSFPIGGVLFVALNIFVYMYLRDDAQHLYPPDHLAQVIAMSHWALAAIIINSLLTIVFGILSGFGHDDYRLTAFLCYFGVSILPAIPFMPSAALFAIGCLGFSYFAYKNM